MESSDTADAVRNWTDLLESLDRIERALERIADIQEALAGNSERIPVMASSRR